MNEQPHTPMAVPRQFPLAGLFGAAILTGLMGDQEGLTMADVRDDPIRRPVLTIEMNEPVERDYLLEDIRDHIVPLMNQGYHAGYMDVPTQDNEDDVEETWSLTWFYEEIRGRTSDQA